jgi:hypothetical protein
MNTEERLREIIRKCIREALNEISTTGNVAGYLTPYAFVGDKHGNTNRIKQMAKSIGYSLTNRGAEDTKPGDKLQERFAAIQEGVKTLQENYYSYRNDETRQPHQKIGQAMSELNRQLKLVERALKMNSRLKKESGLSNDKLWKRTTTQMVKLEGKLTELAARLRDMRN